MLTDLLASATMLARVFCAGPPSLRVCGGALLLNVMGSSPSATPTSWGRVPPIEVGHIYKKNLATDRTHTHETFHATGGAPLRFHHHHDATSEILFAFCYFLPPTSYW